MPNHKLKFFTLYTFICLLIFIPFTLSTNAQSAKNINDILDGSGGLKSIAGNAEINTGPTTTMIVGQLIYYFLAFIGVVFLIIIIYGGFNWMMARGNDEQISKAIKLIESGAIGMIIIALAYLFTNYILLKLIDTIIK